MLQTGLTGELLFLIIVCFCLLILSFSFAFEHGNSRIKQLSLLYFMPLSVTLFLFLYPPAAFSAALLIGSETLLFLGIFIVLQWGEKLRTKQFLTPIPLLLPAVFIALFFIPGITDYAHLLPKYLSYAGIVFLLLSFCGMQQKEITSSYFTLALISMLLTQLLSFLPDSSTARAAYLILKAAAYLMFFLYFYYEINQQIMGKINEAKNILADWDKSVQYAAIKRTIDYEQSQQKLRDMSKIDHLTKSYTKAAIMESINELCADPGGSFTLLMIDLDHFKTINDKLGHLEGDKILVHISSIILNSIRSIDLLGRYGGDEFILLLPRSSIKDAVFVSERLRRRVDEQSNCTISIGLAAFPQDGKTPLEIIAAADKGLYLSKQKGRNSVSYINAS